MNLVKLIEFLRDRLKSVVAGCYVVLGIVVLLDAIPAIVDKEHAHTSIEHWPAFWAVFGFVACAGIIIVSKWFGHAGIMVREDYYEQGAAENAPVAANHGHPAKDDGRNAKNGSDVAPVVAKHGHPVKEHHD